MCTVRVWVSITNSTNTRRSSTVSTWRKSQAGMPASWACRNCRHLGDARRGAGPKPTAARIRARDLTTHDCNLMSQHEDLCILRGVIPRQEHPPAEHPDHEPVDESYQHKRRA
jgi:hypothetical protein